MNASWRECLLHVVLAMKFSITLATNAKPSMLIENNRMFRDANCMAKYTAWPAVTKRSWPSCCWVHAFFRHNSWHIKIFFLNLIINNWDYLWSFGRLFLHLGVNIHISCNFPANQSILNPLPFLQFFGYNFNLFCLSPRFWLRDLKNDLKNDWWLQWWFQWCTTSKQLL